MDLQKPSVVPLSKALSLTHEGEYLWDLASDRGCGDESCWAVHLREGGELFFFIVGGDYSTGT